MADVIPRTVWQTASPARPGAAWVAEAARLALARIRRLYPHLDPGEAWVYVSDAIGMTDALDRDGPVEMHGALLAAIALTWLEQDGRVEPCAFPVRFADPRAPWRGYTRGA